MKKLLTALALVVGVFAVAGPLASATDDYDTPPEPEKVTICHVAGLASDPANHVEITASVNAVFKDQGGHFYENGTVQAGHEQDYIGPCDPPDVEIEPFADYTPPTCDALGTLSFLPVSDNYTVTGPDEDGKYTFVANEGSVFPEGFQATVGPFPLAKLIGEQCEEATTTTTVAETTTTTVAETTTTTVAETTTTAPTTTAATTTTAPTTTQPASSTTVATPKALPATGSDLTGTMAIIAGLLTLVGGSLVAARRRG